MSERVRPVVRVGLLGCGVVGGGVVEALARNRDRIVETSGAALEVRRIAVRDLRKARNLYVDRDLLCDDWAAVCADPAIDVVVEAMGGLHPARDAIVQAIDCGKSVVTANKQLLALYGPELEQRAAARGVSLYYEASVLGGIPAVHTLQTYFAANRVRRLRGIVNGTCNFVLTRMEEAGVTLHEALAEAQRLGYAEADPSQDIDGDDALYKLQILTRALAGQGLDLAAIPKQGIRSITLADVQKATSAGRRWKHVVEVSFDDKGRPVSASVGPVALTADDPLYRVGGVQNALAIEGDLVGEVTLMGPGAGALATASAIVEDLVKWLTRLTSLPSHHLAPTPRVLVCSP
jgi:homoserine dehydrogenase